MSWIFLVIAGIFEVVGVMGMNRITKYGTWTAYFITIIGFIFSFGFLTAAMQTLPLGVSYAVWTGIGTIGGTLIGMMFYGESKNWKRLLFIAMIIISVIGLKWTS